MITDLNDIYFSSVTTKFENGRRLFREHNSRLKADESLMRELTDLDTLIASLQEQMATMSMFKLCVECGSKREGGCCSAFMAGETDGMMILINLLLGVDVGFQRDDGFECVYLGPSGCIFKAKPIFCLNYNCRAIYEKSPPEDIANLDKAAGGVLRQQYKVEQKLLRIL